MSLEHHAISTGNGNYLPLQKLQHSTTFDCYFYVVSNLKYLIILVLAAVVEYLKKWRKLCQVPLD